MSMDCPSGEKTAIECLANIKHYLSTDTPIICLSSTNDIHTRLSAVRAGASHYYEKPLVETKKLIETLDSLTNQIPSNPFHILIIDDDQALTEYCKTILSNKGMSVSAISDPLKALEAINEFQPELILLDIYMPSCSGLELAKVIRQDHQLANTPIIFLSSESRLEKQLSAMNLGGDDFITKPIDAEVLVATVTAKAGRARQVNQLMREMKSVMRENEYQRLALDQHAIVSMTDTQGNIFYVNEKFTQISEYQPHEVLGKNHRLLKSGAHSDEFYEEMWQTISQGKTWKGEVCNRKKNGDLYWVESTIIPFLDELGLPYQYISIRTDITKLIEAEAARGQQRRELQTILDSVPAMIWYKDTNNNILRCNQAAAKVVNLQAQQIVECNACEIYPENANIFYKGDLEVIQSGKPKRESIETLTTPSGEKVWLSVDRIPYLNENNELIGVIVFALNITRRRKAEEALSESEKRLSMSQSFANIGTWDWDIQSNNLFWSERIAPLFGYESGKTETTYENFLAAIHPDDREMVTTAISNCVEHSIEYNIEHRAVWQDGSIRWLQEKGDVVRDEAGTALHMLGVVQDITERKFLEQTMAEQKILLMMLRHATTRFMTTSSFSDAADFLLEGLLSLTHSEFGFTGEILVENGEPYLKSHAISAPPAVLKKLQISTGMQSTEIKDLDNLFGSTIKTGEAIISNSPEKDPRKKGLFDGLMTLNNYLGVPIYYGNELVGMYAIINRQGGYDEKLIEFLKPFTATYGVLIWSKRNTDNEAKRQHELIRAKDEAEQANQAKSTFLSNMSHELRTPMNAILGFSQLLESEVDDPDQKDSINEIIRAGSHLLKLINEVLDLSRIEAGHIDLSLESVDLEDVLFETLSLIQPLADQKNISIHYNSDQFETCIHADRTRLKQIFINLLSNSIKYNKAQGSISLSCQPMDSGMLQITIIDTGIGITDDEQAQLFKPFSRVGAEKTHTEGTGIGLVLTKHLIELMGGSITLTSKYGQGTTISFELPAQNTPAYINEVTQQENNKREAISATSQSHTLLYVEDNPANLKLISHLLAKRTEIKLITAHSGTLGVEAAIKHEPGIILLDINLQDMSGFDVLEALRLHKRFDNTPILALSANAMQQDIEKGLAAGFDEYLTKPINIHQFMSTINSALTRIEQAGRST